MTESRPLNLLRIDASARTEASVTRLLTDNLIAALEQRHGRLRMTTRDLARSAPSFVDGNWIAASYTEPQARDSSQHAALTASDALVAELMAADLIVLGVPVYNFGIPATLKAWIDMVARARVTFRYSETGVEGLLKGKKAYLVMASGGVPVGSAADFASGYLRHVLAFLGIDDVEIIAADQLMQRSNAAAGAQARIRELLAADAA